MKKSTEPSLRTSRKLFYPALVSGLFVMSTALLTSMAAQAETGSNNAENTANSGSSISATVPINDASALISSNTTSNILPPDYDDYLIMQGKQVYEQLLDARQGALNKNKAKLMAGLDLAKASIEKLQLPTQLIALDKQLGVIKQDLEDKNSKLDGELWVPVEAQLQAAMTFSSDEVINPTVEKARQGLQAAQNNNRDKALSIYDELVLASRYNLGIFPLTKVREDLDSALQAANAGPYWVGADEALQSALASFHWYSKVPSHGLLSAYTDLVNAYSLSLAPQIRPDQAQAVDDQLAKAVEELKKVPDTTELQAEVQKLINQVKPEFVNIKLLLQDIQEKIRIQQQQEHDQFYESIANEPIV